MTSGNSYKDHLAREAKRIQADMIEAGMHSTLNYDVDALAPFARGAFDGEKFPGGYGSTGGGIDLDYWTLRTRSAEMFNTNLYARGIIRRLVTNEINTGLHLESTPEETIIGVDQDTLDLWTENVENRFTLWGSEPTLCDWRKQNTFGKIQRFARRESLIEGDVLAVLHHDEKTKLPCIQLISGSLVTTPFASQAGKVVHGVHVDEKGRHLGFWVRQSDLTHKYIPAYGPKSGRKLAWLVYGTDNRTDDVRGTPLLGILLQSLKELDRYRDATLRRAVVNSILAMFIEKNEDKPGSMPMTGAAKKRDLLESNSPDDVTQRRPGVVEMIPGVVMERLQHGEKPHAFNTGLDVNAGVFEEAIVQAMAWCCEIPPEILRLAFSNNYSASQAAINEFKIYLNMVREQFGAEFCKPVYVEWFLCEIANDKIKAGDFLASYFDPARHDYVAAWLSSDWSGAIKPSTDILKQGRGYKQLIDEGWITNDRASRELTGTKFSMNIKRLLRENRLKQKARDELGEFMVVDKTTNSTLAAMSDLTEALNNNVAD